MKIHNFLFSIGLYLTFASCNHTGDSENLKLFELMDSKEMGITFENNLPYTEEYNTYTYRNFYNGGGVALGDVNNDGLLDIYFTGNLTDNKLYINKGKWQFEDVTEKAGVACNGVWSTGATFVDINGDGLLDLYVCKAGRPGGERRYNELFINQGNLTFKESAKEYGLDITGLSVHSAFFDFDKDGDLDCYLLNNSIRSVGGFDMRAGLRDIPDAEGNIFFINEGGKFVPSSQKVGTYSSNIGYGLGITLSDFNNDDWTDIFISNDFFERDYLYINNQKGGFDEVGVSALQSMSMGSMGADAADLDNDLNTDLFVTEMLPQSLKRRKTKNQYETWDKYQESVNKGYHHQYSRNALQRNMGDGSFLEIGRYAGVEATDWSWAALIQDFDNDGLKDIFVSNGIGKDLLDKDYLNFYASQSNVQSRIDKGESVIKSLIDSLPTQPLANRMFKNKGQFKFDDVGQLWGLDEPSFSTGSAYGDLDNDGDLDLVVNNVNMKPFIYKNLTDTFANRFVSINLMGSGQNTKAIGAKVYIKSGSDLQVLENYAARGFESSVADKLHFGLGSIKVVDTILVNWPDGSQSVLTEVASNQVMAISDKDAKYTGARINWRIKSKIETNVEESQVDFIHRDFDLNLFANDRLLLEMPGFIGPAIAVGDVNKDGVDDVFCGGGKNQASTLYLSMGKGFEKIDSPFEDESRSEAIKASFFDSDSDGDLDLYIAHGGKAFSSFSPELHDQLYLNDGKGNFALKADFVSFPRPISTSDFVIEDLDKDGRPDIVMGEFANMDIYGDRVGLHILYNKGNNVFEHIQDESYARLGLVRTLNVVDVDGDGWKEICVAGHWMPIQILKGSKGRFDATTKIEIIPKSTGMWNTILVADLDGDGNMSLICGNQGINNFYKVSDILLINDFDQNGSIEQVVFQKEGDKYYSIHDVDELFGQLPYLKKKFLYYDKCASASLQMMFTEDQIAQSQKHQIEELESVVYEIDNGKFVRKKLPNEVQYSTVNAISLFINAQGQKSLWMGGNNYKVKPQFGRQDASFGWGISIEKGEKELAKAKVVPLGIRGQIRNFQEFNGKYIVGINNQKIRIVER